MQKNKKQVIILQLAILLLFYSILTIRRDGYFPFSKFSSVEAIALFQFIQSLLFLLLILIFIFAEKVYQVFLNYLSFFERRFSNFLLLTFTIQLALIFFLLYYDSFKFPNYYSFNSGITSFIFSIILFVVFALIFLKKSKLSLFTVFLSSFVLFVFPIFFFKITANLSDLLPIMNKQLEAFVSGENIYQYYLLDNGVWTQAVRQPGTTLSFLPAYIAGIDLRFMSILFTLLTAFNFLKVCYSDLKKIIYDRKFLFTLFLIILFLFFPYRHIRHDLYEPFYWFLLSLGLFYLKKSKLLIFSIVWGLSIFTQVWSWIFSPFISIYIWRKFGIRKCILFSIMYLLLGFGLLSIFVLRDISAYQEHVFLFYEKLSTEQSFASTTIYMTPVVQILKLGTLLRPLQFVSYIVILIISFFLIKNFRRLIYSLILCLFFFIQFNILSWNYMYINILVLMTFSVCIFVSELKIRKRNSIP